MATPAEHQAKADRHLAFLATISDAFPEWLATVAFYAAVELIEKLLARHGHHSQSHFERKSALKRHFPSAALNRAYFDLYNASLDARYLSVEQCPDVKDVREVLIAKRLESIRQYVESHLDQ
ncbi:MAG TPA: hypothetical protein VGX78_08085 [Pirellulales bacterium]|jgi:hypothetical protein|nr:hypothetical protein [Pirellulales bacterium]